MNGIWIETEEQLVFCNYISAYASKTLNTSTLYCYNTNGDAEGPDITIQYKTREAAKAQKKAISDAIQLGEKYIYIAPEVLK